MSRCRDLCTISVFVAQRTPVVCAGLFDLNKKHGSPRFLIFLRYWHVLGLACSSSFPYSFSPSLLYHLIFFPLLSSFFRLHFGTNFYWFSFHHPDKWAVPSQNFTKHKSIRCATLNGFLLTVSVNVSDHWETTSPKMSGFMKHSSWNCQNIVHQFYVYAACRANLGAAGQQNTEGSWAESWGNTERRTCWLHQTGSSCKKNKDRSVNE